MRVKHGFTMSDWDTMTEKEKTIILSEWSAKAATLSLPAWIIH
jgi:hypothetical protein